MILFKVKRTYRKSPYGVIQTPIKALLYNKYPLEPIHIITSLLYAWKLMCAHFSIPHSVNSVECNITITRLLR